MPRIPRRWQPLQRLQGVRAASSRQRPAKRVKRGASGRAGDMLGVEPVSRQSGHVDDDTCTLLLHRSIEGTAHVM